MNANAELFGLLCLVNFIPPEFKSTRLAWKNKPEPSGMMIRWFDICIIAVTGMTALISKFFDGSSEAMTFSGRLATFWFFLTFKEGHCK